VIDAAPGKQEPPAVSVTGEVVTVTDGEVTFFLGEHQARTVRAGETVKIPARIEWWFHNTGDQPAAMTRASQS
jgi:quercetin dioxygenase-like cupin family protein